MYDKIEKLSHSLIQHGPNSNRIYLMKLDKQDMPDILPVLDRMAQLNCYTKIFAKVNERYKDDFASYGYRAEAYIPGFYSGNESVFFMCKYLDKNRLINQHNETIINVINIAKSKYDSILPYKNTSFEIKKCTIDDLDQMVSVYKKVFDSYPFPIDDKDYLLETMNDHINYYCVMDGDKIVALSSSEEDNVNLNSEMTDFATLDDYRGQNISLLLLQKMEEDLKSRSFKTAYTIARSLSYGMNITFSKAGYAFSGTLINNTNICGSLEPMNVWYKSL